MTTRNERTTIVGVFHDRTQAQQAINDLKRAGFRDDQIGVTSPDGSGGGKLTTESGESYAAEAGATGLAAGAGVGALWGLGIVSGVLPAIGPAIAGGTLAAILSSAAAGAAAAGIAGALIGMGIPKDEAEYYEGEFKAGRTIVTVHAQGRNAEALSILHRHGGYEKGSASGMAGAVHATSALREGAPSTATAATATGAACSTGQAGHSQGAVGSSGHTVQAREEQLHVNKEREQVGEVVVKKEVHTEHKTIDVPVEREEVVIERRPATGPATGSPLQEGQTIPVPVTEEQVEVTKTPVVKEEVSIGKRKVQGTQKVTADVRKEEIKVEREGQARIKNKR